MEQDAAVTLDVTAVRLVQTHVTEQVTLVFLIDAVVTEQVAFVFLMEAGVTEQVTLVFLMDTVIRLHVTAITSVVAAISGRIFAPWTEDSPVIPVDRPVHLRSFADARLPWANPNRSSPKTIDGTITSSAAEITSPHTPALRQSE